MGAKMRIVLLLLLVAVCHGEMDDAGIEGKTVKYGSTLVPVQRAQIEAADVGAIVKVEVKPDDNGDKWVINGMKINTADPTKGPRSGNGVFYVETNKNEIKADKHLVTGVGSVKVSKCQAQYCAREEEMLDSLTAAFKDGTPDADVTSLGPGQ